MFILVAKHCRHFAVFAREDENQINSYSYDRVNPVYTESVMTASLIHLQQALVRAFPGLHIMFAGFLMILAAAVGLPTAKADGVLETDFARAELLSAVEATGNLDEVQLALQVSLQPGWKIYWRSPGDAGLPTRLSLSAASPPEQALTMDYPIPGRFSLFGLDTYGYGDKVVFPVRLSGHQPGQALDLQAQLDALVCSDICVPFAGPLSLSLPAGEVKPSVEAQTIARASALVPRLATGRDLVVSTVWFDAALASLFVQLAETDAQSGQGSNEAIDDIFVETDVSGLSFARPIWLSDGRYQIRLSGAVDGLALTGQPVRLTVRTANQFSEQALTVSAPSVQHTDRPALLLMVLFALAGGLILNIMPCVLPVLSLKLTSIVSMATSQPHIIRLRLLTGAAGILCSFAVLTAGLVALKVAGARLGWGIQFQNLYFLTAMVLLMGLFTLVLLDRLSLPTPQFTGDQATGHLSSDFMSGFLATLLATPCSAPLVGTAVSFALSGSLFDLSLILMMMGVGLAVPWLVLALFPRLVLMMPKPGPWLSYVRPVLAAGLVLTILWLLWLISVVSTALLAAVLLTALVLMAAVAVFAQGRFAWPVLTGVMVAAMLSSAWLGVPNLPLATDTAGQGAAGTSAGTLWQPWSTAKLAELRRQNRPVFVDVTADWCVTCKVNKQVVLDRASVQQAFAAGDVVLLRADWTRPDDAIADYLLSYGRFGIPFNILYLPGQTEPVIFSELLSAEKILSVLEKRPS